VPVATAAAVGGTAGRELGHLRDKARERGQVRVIVGVRAPFAPEPTLARAEVARQRQGIRSAQAAVLTRAPLAAARRDGAYRFDSIPFMAMQLDADELEAVINDPDVASVQEDRLAAPTLAQSTPLVGATAARNAGFSGTGQVVAVLDTGVDKTHPFLAGRVVSEACYSTTSSSNGSTSVCPGGASASTASGSGANCGASVRGCDHGTHVAGIVAGSNGSMFGVAPGATLVSIQVFSRFDDSGACSGQAPCALTYFSDVMRGLQRIYDLRSSLTIAAVNMSLGGGKYTDQASCDSANLGVKAAIDNLRAANIATVISSGNDGYADGLGTPGCISSAVSVGSTFDEAGWTNSCRGNDLGGSTVDEVACYSNSASFLKLLAPGSLVNSSVPGGGYANFQGTSMAAPQVAGAWAVLKQKVATLTVTQALDVLGTTGLTVSDPRNGFGKPRIRVDQALAALPGANTRYRLTVSRAGSGGGSVASSPSGIACGTDCTEDYLSGTPVTLTATAAADSVFAGWSGDCSGSGASCAVTMSAARSVIASFAPTASSQPDLTVIRVEAPTIGQSEGEVPVLFEVKNQGLAASDPHWLGILVSTNDVITAGIDIDSGWGCSMSALDPGQTQVCEGTITLPKLEPGSYFIGGLADQGNAVAESNENNNGGVAASPTTISAGGSQEDYFPFGGQFPAGWQTPAGSSAPWRVTTDTRHAGVGALASGSIGDGQRSDVSVAVALAAGNVTFAVRVSSEVGYDYLRFYIDGVQKGEWSGEQEWSIVSYPVTAGIHELKWSYAKDFSVSSGGDVAWIDTLQLPGTTPGAPTLSRLVAGNGTITAVFVPPGSGGDSGIVGYVVTCTGPGTTRTATGTASPITVSGLVNGATHTCSVRAVNGSGAGTASATMTRIPRRGANIAPLMGIILSN